MFSKKRPTRAISACEALVTGELRDRARGTIHLSPVGALGARANRPAPFTQLPPKSVAIDEDAALVQHLAQEQRGIGIDSSQLGDIDPISHNRLEELRQLHGIGGVLVGERHQQIEVGPDFLVSPCNRAVEHSEAYRALGTESLAKLSEQAPVLAQILALPIRETESPGTGSLAAQRTLRCRTAESALLCTQICSYGLDRSHSLNFSHMCPLYA